VTTIAYNMWDQAETTEELIGKTTRTKTTTFDAADHRRDDKLP
jgi:hypothetical protein